MSAHSAKHQICSAAQCPFDETHLFDVLIFENNLQASPLTELLRCTKERVVHRCGHMNSLHNCELRHQTAHGMDLRWFAALLV